MMVGGNCWIELLSLAGGKMEQTNVLTSVTRVGDLFDFGQLLKAFGNN